MGTSAYTTTYTVTGMTCQHCVAAVTEEVGKVTGVQHVAVDLSADTVAVTGPAAQADVAAAVVEAGYTLTGVVA